jgi:hypothetical protein
MSGGWEMEPVACPLNLVDPDPQQALISFVDISVEEAFFNI